jgi:L-2,4-diaminobutyric acid acetyltransferase
MISIRSLAPEDRDALWAIDADTAREYRAEAWDALSPAEREREQASALEFETSLASGFSLVATEDAEVIAFLLAFREPLAYGRLYVWQVTVSLKYRRKGVARALYEELIRNAKAAGLADIRAHIDVENEPSQRLHASVGFELTPKVQASLLL